MAADENLKNKFKSVGLVVSSIEVPLRFSLHGRFL